jgi:mRNA interferase HigB
MEILNRDVLVRFARQHPPSRKPLSRWVDVVSAATWKSIVDVQRIFKSAEDVKGYVIFNIHGNDYRLITVIRYDRGKIFVQDMLTHSGYDRWEP